MVEGAQISLACSRETQGTSETWTPQLETQLSSRVTIHLLVDMYSLTILKRLTLNATQVLQWLQLLLLQQ